jgi:hypothetical protein
MLASRASVRNLSSSATMKARNASGVVSPAGSSASAWKRSPALLRSVNYQPA